jgi:eukaryotic-like serine/threonine-protein kinase
MASSARSARIIRFGRFELLAANGELLKDGIPLKLHPQPFRVLLLLAESGGRIVSREEIQQSLWGGNTFVDFEGGINFCIKQVRVALADDARKPRYIETLPRRGYRFIAEVTYSEPRSSVILLTPSPPVVVATARPKPFTPKALIAVCCLAGALIGLATFYLRSPSKLTDRDTIVLADFVNNAGDPMFDEALKQALATELGQSPFLNVLSERRLSETLRMMGSRTDKRITGDVARELCWRTGSKAVLYSAISRVGNRYSLDLNAVACASGDNLAKTHVEAAGKENILKALSQCVSRLRRTLGESLPTVQKFDVPLAATTNSLEALRDYSEGARIGFVQGDAASIPFFKRAIDLDPNFAMAYVALARRYSNLDQPSLSLEYAAKAYALKDRVTEREKLNISSAYFRATGELEKLAQVFELWMADYPRDAAPHGSLGADYMFLGQYDKALVECQNALEMDPDNGNNYANLGAAYLMSNQLDKAQALLNQALARHLDGGGIREELYLVAFLRRNSPLMEQQVKWGVGKPDDEGPLLELQSDTEAYYGRLNAAQDFSRRAVASAVRSGSKEEAALWLAIASLREAEFGSTAEAKLYIKDALALAAGRDGKVLAALALARIGETSRARALIEELERSAPSNTLLKIYWFPIVRAAIALKEGNSSQALEFLQVVAPYEIGLSSSLERGTLYPAYLRGEAYQMAHNGPAAAAEFQKLLDHRGIGVNFSTASLAHLQIARAYALARDNAKAKAAYQDFFTLWKEADPGIAILRRAKAEYAKL